MLNPAKSKKFFGPPATKEAPVESKGPPNKFPPKESKASNDHDEDDSGEKSKPEKSKGEEAVDKYSKTMKKGKKWGDDSKKKTAGFLDKQKEKCS